jgi:hypothetical protein
VIIWSDHCDKAIKVFWSRVSSIVLSSFVTKIPVFDSYFLLLSPATTFVFGGGAQKGMIFLFALYQSSKSEVMFNPVLTAFLFYTS